MNLCGSFSRASLGGTWAWRLAAALAIWARAAAALPAPTDQLTETSAETPTLGPAAIPSALLGRPLAAVEVVLEGVRWREHVDVRSVRVGEPFSAEVARRAARELLSSGRFASVVAEVHERGGAAVLRVVAVPRRLVLSVDVQGTPLDDEALLSAARLVVGGEITERGLADVERRAVAFHQSHGFPSAAVEIEVRDTDDPMGVVLVARVRAGAPRELAARTFVRDGEAPPDAELDRELADLQASYAVDRGDRADEDTLINADRALSERLRLAGYHRARVAHQLLTRGDQTYLYVRVDPGPKLVARYEGLHAFDAGDLDRALDLEKELDKSVRHLGSKVSDFYVRRGFLDVTVDAEERGGARDRLHVLFFRVREGAQVRVTGRDFPCLGRGPLSANEARRDIDSFLEEELPGGGLFGAVDAAEVDAALGPTAFTGARARSIELLPRATYVADTYDRALKHLQDYYRSQGYLSATVGPLALLRRQCARRSRAGECLPVQPDVSPIAACLFDDEGLPIDEPPLDPRLSCTPDPKRGITCEARVRVRVPVKLGPRTYLYDVAFEGNRTLVERDLLDKSELELGTPVSQTEIEAARRRVQEAFNEEGFAFAEVRAVLDFSSDRTRARARFVVSEGERVYVDGIVVRGAKRTNPALVMRRVSFTRCPRDSRVEQCEPYRASDVRKTEERIATLGTFSSVSVSLEDPQVPARRKVVVVEVQERVPQYLDLRPGFSTGEGFRATLEYGHRNLAGQAVQLTLRAQLGYLPDAFIVDPAVRANFDTLPVSQRLERRNTASLSFPEVGLGPLIRLALDGIDVRDNARDFGLSKEAGVATFTYRPARSFSAQIGGSLERNDVSIFRGGTVDAYLRNVAEAGGSTLDLGRLLRVPDGLTFAVAERASFAWDRRDNPFGATRGTLLVASVEHVHAYPSDESPNTQTSDFLRVTGTASGYVRLSESGLAIAVSLRGGRIQQLLDRSKTYPDRLFFMGGVDSLRGFLQDSLVPQDVAEQILSAQNRARPESDPEKLSINSVAIRGGDVFLNPRVELRVPFGGSFEGGFFLDSGNVWVDPHNFDPFTLRYAAGAGIRIATAIGPIAFDYGINLVRRPWEDRGNFHFSIGLF